MRSFYITNAADLAKVAQAEHKSLKDAEKDLRHAQPGDYLIIEVVRSAIIEQVPERTRVVIKATRTRTPRDPSKRARKAKAGSAPEAGLL